MSVLFDVTESVAESFDATVAGLESETEPVTKRQAENSVPVEESTPVGAEVPTGGNASARNSLKDGLTARKVFPPELAADIERFKVMFNDQFQPGNPYESFLIVNMARTSAQLELAARLRIDDLKRCRERARDFWDEDRQTHVLDLAERLPKDAPRVAQALRSTKQGLEWMLDTWDQLAGIVAHSGGIDDDQRRLAFDLLGVRPELRNGSPLVPDRTDTTRLAALVDGQTSVLQDRLEKSLEHDLALRQLAVAGIILEEDTITRRLRRGESTARRDFNKFKAELLQVQAGLPATLPPPKEKEKAKAKAKDSAAMAPTPRPEISGAGFEYHLQRSKLAKAPLEPKTPPVAVKETPVAATARPSTAAKAAPAPAPKVTRPVAAEAKGGHSPAKPAGETEPKPEARPESGRARKDREKREHMQAKAAKDAAKKAAKQQGR